MCGAICTMPKHSQPPKLPVCVCMCVTVSDCACVYLQAHVCIVGANRILLSSSQLCPADESQEAPACVYGYCVEAPA